jgi:hypothetical protein
MTESKSFLKDVKEGGHEPLNLETQIESILPECEALIETTKYAEAFELFASRLDFLERVATDGMKEKRVQRIARRALKQLWKKFVGHSTNYRKFRERSDALFDETNRAVEEAGIQTGQVFERIDQMSQSEKKARAALIAQRKDTIVPLSDERSQEAELDRAVDNYVSAVTSLINKAHEAGEKKASIHGMLFNYVLPLLRRHMEHYVADLISSPKGSSNYTPVTSKLVRAATVNFLAQAPHIAELLSKAQMNRDNEWDTRPKDF